jgi:hypothetical protein
LRACFWLQFLLIPAFLSPINHDHNHPYMSWLASLVGPVCYAGAFSCRAAVRLLKAQTNSKRAVVLAALRNGAFFSVLFGIVVLGSLVVNVSRSILANPSSGASPNWLHVCRFVGILVLYHLAIGAVTGGVVGLACAQFQSSGVRREASNDAFHDTT